MKRGFRPWPKAELVRVDLVPARAEDEMRGEGNDRNGERYGVTTTQSGKGTTAEIVAYSSISPSKDAI